MEGAAENNKINVLCLHGCNQTQSMFEGFMKNIVKMGEKQHNLNFIFTEAEHDHPNGGKTWYNKPLDVKEIGHIAYDIDLTKDALTKLSDTIKTNNIDVLLGFSQGANVVDTYMAHCDHHSIKRVVLMCGYSLVEDAPISIDTSCLSVISANDKIVPFELDPGSSKLRYSKSHVIKHEKGHVLPTSKPMMRSICNFIQSGVIEN